VVPTPILPPKGASSIVPLASTSILGIPETSLTEKIEPLVRLFVMLKSCPAEPSQDNVPEFNSYAF
jgi:hypothetical protein